MQKDLQEMIKRILFFDLIVALILFVITNFMFKEYKLVLILGLFIAFLNFVLNGIITEYALINKQSNFNSLMIIGFVLRVLIVCAIAIMLLKYNKFNVVAYMLGYSSHFISLTLYGIDLKNKD